MNEISLIASELAEITKLMGALEDLEEISVGDIQVLSYGQEIGVVRESNGSYTFEYVTPEVATEEELSEIEQIHDEPKRQSPLDMSPEDFAAFIKDSENTRNSHSWKYGMRNVTCIMCHCSAGSEEARKPCRFGRVL